jgi:hypothetical protein
MTLETQPLNIINKICSYLVMRDVVALSLASKTIRNQKSSIEIHDEVRVKYHKGFKLKNIRLNGVISQDSKYRNVLEEAEIVTIDSGFFCYLASDDHFAPLKELCITDSEIIGCNFPRNLVKLEIWTCKSTGEQWEFRFPKTLKHLEMTDLVFKTDCYNDGNLQKRSIMQLPPNLETLSVKGTAVIISHLPEKLVDLTYDQNIVLLDESFPTSLRKLEISRYFSESGPDSMTLTDLEIEQRRLDQIRTATQLTHLTLYNMHIEGEFDFDNLKLEKLSLNDVDCFDPIKLPNKLKVFMYDGIFGNVIIPDNFQAEKIILNLVSDTDDGSPYVLLPSTLIPSSVKHLNLHGVRLENDVTFPSSLISLTTLNSVIPNLSFTSSNLEELVLNCVEILSNKITLPESLRKLVFTHVDFAWNTKLQLPKSLKSYKNGNAEILLP